MRKLPAVVAQWDLPQLHFQQQNSLPRWTEAGVGLLATDLAACAKVFVLQMIFMLMPKPAHTHTSEEERQAHIVSDWPRPCVRPAGCQAACADKAVTWHLIYDGSLLCRACHNKNKHSPA